MKKIEVVIFINRPPPLSDIWQRYDVGKIAYVQMIRITH